MAIDMQKPYKDNLKELLDRAVYLYLKNAFNNYHDENDERFLVLNEDGKIDLLYNWPYEFLKPKFFYICEISSENLEPEEEEPFEMYYDSLKSIVREFLSDDVERAFDEYLVNDRKGLLWDETKRD